MSFDWQDFLELARRLKAKPKVPGPFEAATRSAVSRAYYSAYHCAEDLAVQQGFVPEDSGTNHQRVQDFFRRLGSETGGLSPKAAREATSISEYLKRLRRLRNGADYDRQVNGLPLMEAEQAIGWADRVYASVAKLTPDE